MSEKTGRLRAERDQQPDEWEQDLHRNSRAGQNTGLEGPRPEKDAPTAFEIKELHERLADYTSDELKQISVLPAGSRLKQGATYINLKDPARREFTATAEMEADSSDWYVPKKETD